MDFWQIAFLRGPRRQLASKNEQKKLSLVKDAANAVWGKA